MRIKKDIEFLFDTLEATSLKFTTLLPPYNQYSVLWCTVCRWDLHSLPNPHPHQEREEKRVCAPMRKIRGWYWSNDFLSLSIAFHHFFFLWLANNNNGRDNIDNFCYIVLINSRRKKKKLDRRSENFNFDSIKIFFFCFKDKLNV